MKYCSTCDKELGKKQTKFCSRSCSATMTNSSHPKRKRMPKNLLICVTCGIEYRRKGTQKKLYCSNICSINFRISRTEKKFENGELHYRPTIRKLLLRKYNKCFICGIESWCGKKISLQIDHINGNPSNDKPDNVRLLCPNCHSQTESYCGKNKGRGRGSLGVRR